MKTSSKRATNAAARQLVAGVIRGSLQHSVAHGNPGKPRLSPMADYDSRERRLANATAAANPTIANTQVSGSGIGADTRSTEALSKPM